jgi:hypothetical protein
MSFDIANPGSSRSRAVPAGEPPRRLRGITGVRPLLASICAVLLTANCTSGTSEEAAPSAEEGRLPASPDAGVFVRSCESSVLGDLGAGWRKDAVIAGPVAFVGARGYEDDPNRSFVARGPRMATAHKVLAVVVGDRPVIVSVQTRDAALFYDPSKWGQSNDVAFRRGDEVTRFEPCIGVTQRSTQFNGGFLVRRPTCVAVRVQIEGGRARVVSLSFGAGTCG